VALLTGVPGCLALAACGGDDDDTASNGITVEVLALDDFMDPQDVTITAGTEVVFRNVGVNPHNIIPEDRDADWRVDVPDFEPGEASTYVFGEPGLYRYYCSLHGTLTAGMFGSITVTAA